MYLTDEEIRAILIAERKRERRKKRIKRRITLAIILGFCLIMGIGLFVNRGVLSDGFVGRGVIFIDPGHGGHDPGAEALGHKEKDDTLALALVVKDELEDMGFKVYMSREDDSYVERSERGDIALKHKAKMMISIHRNQASEGNGAEVWIPSSNSKETRLLGENILDALEKQGFANRGVRPGTLTDEDDDYYENMVEGIPTCIVETGFVSNKGDNKLFDTKLKGNGKAIAEAIEKTFAKLYEEE